MRRSTHLLQKNAHKLQPTDVPDGMSQTFGGGSFNFGGGPGGGFNFGSGGFNFGSGGGFDFGTGGGGFEFGTGGGGFNFGQGGGFNFGGGGGFNFQQQQQQFGFNPGGLFDQSGQFSFNPSFQVESLNQSAFGAQSPFGAGAPLASSDSPDQGSVPEFGDWKEFVAFLFRNGPAWVKAFKEGRISPRGGAAQNAPSSNRREIIQRYMAQRSQQMNQGGVGGFLTSSTGMLLIGGVLIGGIALAAATSGPQRRAVPRRRR